MDGQLFLDSFHFVLTMKPWNHRKISFWEPCPTQGPPAHSRDTQTALMRRWLQNCEAIKADYYPTAEGNPKRWWHTELKDLVPTHLTNFIYVSPPPLLTPAFCYWKQDFFTWGSLQCRSPQCLDCSPWPVLWLLQLGWFPTQHVYIHRDSDSSIRTNSFLLFSPNHNNQFFSLSKHFLSKFPISPPLLCPSASPPSP